MNARRTNLSRAVVAFGVAIVVAGCGDKVDGPSFESADISGAYSAEISNFSELDLNIEIQNQKGTSDVLVQVDRLTPFSQKEKDFLVERNISPQEVINLFSGQSLVMGGDRRVDDNVVEIPGQATRLSVCTAGKPYDGRRLQIQYCLNAQADIRARVLQGNLVLRLVWQGDGVEELPLMFRTLNGQPSAATLGGVWSGDTMVIHDSFLEEPFVTLTIEESGGRFLVSPDRLFFEYNGDTYALSHDESDQHVSYTEDNSTAHFSLLYRGPGQTRIAVQGYFLSNSTLSGTIWYMARRKSLSLGLIDFQRR